MYPEPIKIFAEIFSKLPSIGRRQAIRLAFFFIRKKDLTKEIITSISNLENKISLCKKCFLPFEKNEQEICDICQNPKRNQGLICITEKETDAFAIEESKKYNGVYHILGGLIDPSDPKTYSNPRIESLEKRIAALPEKIASEIIIAMNPTTSGDLTAMYLERKFKNSTQKITKLGRGLPTGGELEFADEETVAGALSGRK